MPLTETNAWVDSDQVLQTLATEVRDAVIEKNNLGWDLDELELAAQQAMERAADSDDEDEDESEIETMTRGLL